jgi:glyoxylase-like metal-dependent hydrolase (beta-lactamase superfamily II)
MIFTQYYLGCLSHASYLIGDDTTGRAVVIDPQRDVEIYLAEARAKGLRIERVLETTCTPTSFPDIWNWRQRRAP